MPFLRDPELRTRRPILFESFVQTNDVNAQGAINERQRERELGGRERQGARLAAGAAEGLRGDPLGPYKYIAWPTARRSSTTSTRTRTSSTTSSKVPNFYPIRNFLHRQLRRFENCVGRECREGRRSCR